MVHNGNKSGYNCHVPSTEDIEMITVSHPNAELLKVFLYKDEKQALKELSQKQGIPMYHLVRKMILELLEQQNESQAS
jgi:transcriptional regulator of NAD metabolism